MSVILKVGKPRHPLAPLMDALVKSVEEARASCADCGDELDDATRVVHPNDRVVCVECDSDYTEQDRC
jgi:formylmethanofuran dehydrogenase subunit E